MSPSRRDRWERRIRRLLGDPVNRWRPWFRELAEFTGLSWWQYQALRTRPHPVWTGDPVTFYQDPYFLLRQAWYRRNESFHTILNVMGESGVLLEYGCGIAPVSAWLAPRKSWWRYLLADLESPQLAYGLWRLRQHRARRYLGERMYQVVVALEILEHLPGPLALVKDFYHNLEPGGHLFVNYGDDQGNENLVVDREATLAFLRQSFRRIDDGAGDYWHYVK